MTVALSPAQREKLAKLLGMLGSNHSGERDAAGLAAHRLVFGAGMTWFDVLTPQVEHHRPEPDDEPGYAKRANSTAWQQAVEMCLGYPNLLSQWEQQFLRDIQHRWRLTPRQEEVLDQIAEKVRNRSTHHQSNRRG